MIADQPISGVDCGVEVIRPNLIGQFLCGTSILNLDDNVTRGPKPNEREINLSEVETSDETDSDFFVNPVFSV